MNLWTKMSVDLANRKNYLDMLYKVYPISPNLPREIDGASWELVERAFIQKDNINLIKMLTRLDLFPIKDSYVAYLKRDPSAMERNPDTINRIAGHLYDLGLDGMYENCTEPKESNRQIGPMFKYWIGKETLGAKVFKSVNDFINASGNAVLNTGDEEMMNFAKIYLGYQRKKGLDFVAKFNGVFVLGEAKFLTDFGGHQDAQFSDAVSTMETKLIDGVISNPKVQIIGIMDGVLYIKGKNKMYKYLEAHDDEIIISSLLLRDFLYSL